MATTINNPEYFKYNNNSNILESWVSGKDKKCVWLRTDKYTVGLEISPSSDYAAIGIRHNSKNPDAHNLSLGVDANGKSFLQVSDGVQIKTVDLFKLISFVDNLMFNEGQKE